MLVLTRNESEQIVIGEPGQVLTEPIVITVVNSKPQRSKIGIEAQRDIRITRRNGVKKAA